MNIDKMDTEKTCNYVYQTNDYTRFKTITGNRIVNKNHLARLKKSIKEKYLMVPIIVNDKMEIIDGQTRFIACRELKKPIYYIVNKDYGLNEVQRLNMNLRSWTANDFMNGYCELKNPEYLTYRDFKRRHGFGHQETMCMLAGRHQHSWSAFEEFRNGDFYVKDLMKAEEWAAKIEMVRPYYSGYKRRTFIYAILALLAIPGYSHTRMINKLSYQSLKLFDCNNTKQYRELLHEIYNYRVRGNEKMNLREL